MAGRVRRQRGHPPSSESFKYKRYHPFYRTLRYRPLLALAYEAVSASRFPKVVANKVAAEAV